MSTFMPKADEIERKWYVIDAADKPLGKVATEVATLLRGKHKPIFMPNTDCGDFVIIINAENRKMMVEDFIKLVDKAWKESLIHSSYPYTKLAEEYQLKPEFFYAFHEFFQSEEFTIDGEN